MKISSWNIRGLNQPLKQTEISKFIFANDLDVLGILETKVRMQNQDKIKRVLPNHWTLISNTQSNSVDRIWIGWNPNKVNLTILNSTSQVIHVYIESLDQAIQFFASFVYGANSIQDRRTLWTDLRDCSLPLGDLPWISLGDFNAVLNLNEIFGGNRR